MKQCVTCLQWKKEDEFNWRFKHLGQRHKICRDCQHIHQRKWYENHKKEHIGNVAHYRRELKRSVRDYVFEYLKTHPCVDCGENDPVVLEFDHRRGNDKRMEVSKLINGGYSIEKVMEEINKCEVRCANCHRRRTAIKQNWFRNGTWR